MSSGRYIVEVLKLPEPLEESCFATYMWVSAHATLQDHACDVHLVKFSLTQLGSFCEAKQDDTKRNVVDEIRALANALRGGRNCALVAITCCFRMMVKFGSGTFVLCLGLLCFFSPSHNKLSSRTQAIATSCA